jgi:flagellin-specific chaperone FliS
MKASPEITKAEATIKALEAAEPSAEVSEELGGAYFLLGDLLVSAERFEPALENLDTAHRMLQDLGVGWGELAVQAQVRMLAALMALGRAQETLSLSKEIIDMDDEERIEGGLDPILWSYWWRLLAQRSLHEDRNALDTARVLIRDFAAREAPVEKQLVARVRTIETELAAALGG